MAEDNYKIQLQLELEQSSIADVQKQVERALSGAVKNAMKNVDLGAAIPSAGSVKSTASSVGVKGSDFPKQIDSILKSNFKTFAAGVAQMTATMDKLTAALDKQSSISPTSAGGGPVKPERTQTKALSGQEKALSELGRQLGFLNKIIASGGDRGRQADRQRDKVLGKAKRIASQPQRLAEQANKNLRKSVAIDKKLNAVKEKEVAIRNEYLSQLKKDAAGFRRGGFSASGGGRDPLEATKSRPTVGGTQANQKIQSENRAKFGGRQQAPQALVSPKDKPGQTGDGPTDRATQTDRRSLVAAIAKGAGAGGGRGVAPPGGERTPSLDYAKQAQQDITNAGKTLANAIESIIKHMPDYKGTDVAKALNLPSAKDLTLRDGGAVPTIKSGSGREKHLGSVVTIIGQAVTRLDRITHNFKGIEQQIEKIADADRRHGARGGTGTRDALQKLFREKMGDAPMYEKHQAMGSFMKASESKVIFQPDQKQAARIMGKGEEGRVDAAKLGEVEATFFKMTRAGKQFVQAGVEVVSMLGLTEEAASDMAKSSNWGLKQNKKTGQYEGQIVSKMQTRPVQQLQPGGGNLMKQSRTLFLKGISKITDGERPVIQSPYHKEMMDKGHITPSARNLKTAIMSSRNVPEIHEDQSLITQKAARNLGMFKETTKFIKDPAEDLQVGMGLQDKQHMGINAAGKAVEMALHGTAATITSMTRVMKNDVPMTAVTYEEFNAPGTGMKMTTAAGIKSEMKVITQEEMDKTGAPKGTEILTSAEGMARRGDYQDVITMISTAMSEGGKVSAQLLFDAITGALNNNPKLDMLGAVKQVGAEYGIDPNVAMKETQGALKAQGVGKALQGTAAWYRLEKEGQTGPSDEGDRYMDPVTMSSMKKRQETLAYAMAAEEKAHLVVAKEQVDYHKVLRGLSGATENVTSDLKKMQPEDFNRMPGKTVEPDMLKRTLADKDYAKGAFNLQLPKFGGGTEDFFMPSIGTAVGQREVREDSETGLSTAGPLTKAFEQVRQSALEIRAATGQLDPSESTAVQQEGAEFANKMMNRQIDELKPHLNKEGTKVATEEGKQIAAQLVSAWMPLIKMMETAGMSAGIRYKERSTTGKEKEQRFGSGPQKYVDIAKDPFQKLNRMRDVLAIRAGGDVNKASSSQRAKGIEEFESIRSIGPIFKDIEMLNATLKILGKTAAEDERYMAGLWATLEEGKGVLLDKVTEQGFGKAGTPAREELRRVSQTRGAGIQSGSMYSKAIEYNVDITEDLKVTEKHLRAIGKAGGDVGDALSALERIRSLQVSEDVLPRDAVLLSKKDYANMKSAVKRDAKLEGEVLTDKQAEGRMTRGIVGRFPITGGESQRPMRFLEDKTGKLPEGKVGVPGTFAVGAGQDLKTMRGPMEGFRKSLIDIININNGFGAAADEARGKLREINSAMDGTTQAFQMATSNLDFDGDNLVLAAANSEEAARRLKTSVEILKQFGFSAQNALRTVQGNLEGPQQDFSSLEGINKAFGSLVKGRPGEDTRIPPRDDAETARREAQGLVGGKLSVGILSDAFNLFHQAIIGGSKLTSDAFSTAKDLMMLDINKGLAAKHGTGDQVGPLEMLKDISRGPEGIKRIREGMASGKGFYGAMGKKNQEIRDKYKEMLPGVETQDLTQMALQEGVLKEGDEVTPSNYKSVVDQLMDKMDIAGQLQSIWDRIESNLRESLRKQGMGSADIDQEVKRLTTVDKKTGAIPGVDLRSLTTEPFQISKRKGSEALKKQTRMERARSVLNANFEDLNLDKVDVDPAEPRKLSADLESWMQGVLGLVGVLSDADIKGMGRDPKSVAGMFQPGPPGSSPGAGAVMLGESSRVRPLSAAIEALEKMESGAIRRLPKTLNFVANAIKNVTSTLGHEKIHEASKVPGTEAFKARQQISTQLMEGTGAIGADRDVILKAAQELPSIKKQAGIYKELTGIQMLGDKEGKTRIGSDIGEGEFTGMTADDAVAKQGQKYMNMVAEEVMAHLNNPEKWMQIFKTIPEGTREVLVGMFTKIKAEMSELFGPLEGGAQDLLGRVQALGVEGTPEAAKVRSEAQRKIDLAGDAPAQERGRKVGLLETILKKARSEYELQPGAIDDKGMLATQGAVSFPLEQRAGIDSSAMGMRKQLMRMEMDPETGDIPAPAQMVEMRDEFKQGAELYRKQVEAESEDVGGGKKAGRKAYTKAMQEFDAAEQQMYINRAKLLEDAITLLRGTGQTGGPEFRATVEALDDTIAQAKNSLMRTKIPGVSGQQGLAIDKMTGQLRAEAGTQEGGLGIEPGKQTYEEIVKRFAPRGTEAQPTRKKDFMEGGLGKTLLEAQENIASGADKTKEWQVIWQKLKSEPETFAENLERVAKIMKEFGGTMWSDFGPAAAQTQDMQALAKIAGEADRDLKKDPTQARIRNLADIEKLEVEKPSFKRAQFGGGTDIKNMIKGQQSRMEQARVQFENDLNDMLKAGVQPKGGRHVDSGKKFDLTGPNNMAIKTFNLTAKKGVDGYTASLVEATKAAGHLTGAMRNSLRRVVQWGFATGIVYGVIRGFRTMMTTIKDVETRITNLKKVMDTSITNFDKMQDSATGFAQEFGVSIEEVLDGMVVYGQQGLKVNKIMERTRATMLAVNVTTLSAVQATEALTAAHKVFGDAVSGSVGFVDAWAAVAAKHAITAADLADAVKRSGAAAEVAGVGFNDFLGIITAIGSVTRQTGKEVATSTKFMFRAMRRPTAQKELAGMNISSMEAGGDFRPAVDIMKELAGRWDGLTRAQQVNLAQAMAGIRHYNSFIVLMNNFDEALLASADAANSQGFAMRKNRLSMATLSKQMVVLKESAKGVVLELGKIVLPFATWGIEGITSMTQAVGKLPTALLQAVAGMAGFMLIVHKGADLFADTMDAMRSGETAMGAGAPKTRTLIAGRVRSMGKGMMEGWRGAAGVGIAADATTGLGRAAGRTRKLLDAVGKKLLRVGSGAISAGRGLTYAAGAAKVFNAALISTVGGVVLFAIGAAALYAYTQYKKATVVAKDFEQSQEDIIGKSEDAASALRSQMTQADALSLAYNRIASAQKRMADIEGTASAIAEGRFKGAATAAQKYSNMLAEINHNLGMADPTRITGITDTGDLIIGIADNFKSLTSAALDAQNAITTALKIDTIKAYSEEMKEPIEKFREVIAEMKKITAERKKNAGAGGFEMRGTGELLVAEEKRAKLSSMLLENAENVKRIFESIPEFQGFEAAMEQVSKIRDDLEQAASLGIFGRGATGQSVINQFMGKQAGLGGVMDFKNTQSAGLTANAFLERGIKGVSGTGTEGALASIEADKQIVMISSAAAKALDIGTQRLFSEFSASTGELMLQYFDMDTGQLKRKAASEVEEVARILESTTSAHHVITWAQKTVDAAAEGTRRLLTTQFTGALAGIRVPSGGMPQTGPARSAELTIEQRVMKSLPKDIQRLSEVQKEYNVLAKEYSEILESDVKGAYTEAGSASKDLKVATHDVLEMAVRLQREGFHLTVLANYEKLQQKLNQTLEQSARAAKDYASAERDKNRFLTANAGAMQGMALMPALELGKSFKELSGLEKMAIESPGFGGTARGIKATSDKRQRDVDSMLELKKQLADFDEAVLDMGKAGSEMEAAQDAKLLTAIAKGANKGQIAMIDAMDKEAQAQLDVGHSQLDVQHKMLKELDLQTRLLGQADAKGRVKVFSEAIRGTEYKELVAAYAKATSISESRQAQRDVMGLVKDSKTHMLTATGSDVEGINEAAIRDIARLSNAMIKLEKGATVRLLGLNLRSKGVNVAGLESGGIGRGNILDDSKQQLFRSKGAIQDALNNKAEMVFTESAAALKALKTNIADQTARLDPAVAKAKAEEEALKNESDIAVAKAAHVKAGNIIRQKINDQISNLQTQLEEGNTELQKASREIRLAQAARNLATSLEDMVREFKNAEAAVVIKLKSDLEGPFARVGKPGFKTDFEQRREELKSGASRPMSLEAMRERDKARKQLSFDEKEAKIQQKQAIETSALKRQQSRAEQVRTKMQEIMDDPDQTAGVRSRARSFFETLGDELATSEQADKRGDKLFFKGIPALDGLANLADAIKKDANDRIRNLKKLGKQEDNKELLEAAARQLHEQKDMARSLRKIAGLPTDTGDVSLDDLGAVGTGPGAAEHSQTASTRRPATTSGTRSTGAAVAGVGSADALSTSEWVKALKDASRMQQEGILGKKGTAEEKSQSKGLDRILENARNAGVGAIVPKEAGMGSAVTALLAMAKTTKGMDGGIPTKMGPVFNDIKKIGNEVVATSRLGSPSGKIIGLETFEHSVDDLGNVILKSRHISGDDATKGIDLHPDARRAGVGKNRYGMVLDEFPEATIEHHPGMSAARRGQIESVARDRGRFTEIPEGNLIDTGRGIMNRPGFDEPGMRVSPMEDMSALDRETRTRIQRQQVDRARFHGPDAEHARVAFLEEEGMRASNPDWKPDARTRAQLTPPQRMTEPVVEPKPLSRTKLDTDPRYIRPGLLQDSPASAADVRASLDKSRTPMGRVAEYGDDAYQTAVNRINSPLEVDLPGRRLPDLRAGPNAIEASIKDARWDKGVGAEYQASVGAREPWDRGIMDEYKVRAEAKAGPDAMARLRASSTAAKSKAAADASKAAADASPFGPEGGVIGEDVPVGKPKAAAVSSAADAVDEGIDVLKAGSKTTLKTMVKTIGKIVAPIAVAIDTREMIGGALQAEKASTPEELRAAAGRTVGAGLDIAAGTALIGGGAAIGGWPGAIGGAALYGAGKASDYAFGNNDSLPYAGQYYDDMSGGRIGEGLQWAGKKMMSPGNALGDSRFAQSGMGQSMADWEMPNWMRTIGDAGPAPTPGVPAPRAPKVPDASAYAALGMPDPLTGAAAPGGATPVPAKAKDWDAIVAQKMEEDRLSKLYSADQMAPMGPDGKDQFFGSATSRTSGEYKDSMGKTRQGKGPGTFIPSDVLGGEGTVDLNEYIQRMQDTRASQAIPNVGNTNSNLEQQRLARGAGDPSAVPGGIITTDTGVPGTQNTSAADRVNRTGTATTGDDGTSELASAIDSLNSKLDDLTDIKIDTSEITTAIGVSTTEIVSALGSELSVSISNSVPLDVNVISQPAGAAADAASAGGPDVTVLAANLENLLGVQDIQKTDIDALTTRVTTGETTDDTQNTNIATLQNDTQGLDAATISTQITSEISTVQDTIQGELSSALATADGKIVAVDVALGVVRQTADNAKTTADGLEDQIQTASDNALDAKITADATKDLADATKITADNAAIVAGAAQSEASLATAAIDKITQTVNSNRQGIEAEVRTVKGVVGTNKSVGTDNASAIRKLQGDLASADSKAQSALARTHQR